MALKNGMRSRKIRCPCTEYRNSISVSDDTFEFLRHYRTWTLYGKKKETSKRKNLSIFPIK